MSRVISRHTLRCLELAILVTVLNLLLSFCVVQWYTSPAHGEDGSPVSQDSRLLLSVAEYPDTAPHSTPTLPPSPPAPQAPPAPDTSEAQAQPELLKYKYNLKQQQPERSEAEAGEGLPSLDLGAGVWDKYRLFRSHMFTVTPSNWAQLSTTSLVCLGAQTSVDRLHELPELVTNWSGPLSIAVFGPAAELGIAVHYIRYLRSCNAAVRAQAAFHLVYPGQHPGTLHSAQLAEMVGRPDCSQPKQVLQYMLATRDEEMMSWRRSYAYPQNLLRNLAKAGCQTNYTYIPDIDMVPSPGMAASLETFLARDQQLGNCTKCAFVIPTYEIASDAAHLPRNKTELVSFVAEKKARQFHQAVYSINQKSSNLARWEKLPETAGLGVAYTVDKYIFKYEPLYVARADTPPFDERFIGFGMTRNTQVYEMFVAGYSFHLLDNVFTSHWGFQTYATRPAWRARQMEENNAKFDEFAKELSAHYNADPYDMLSKLKKMNLKHVKVAASTSSSKNKTSKSA